MSYELDKPDQDVPEPTLAEMTAKAIQVLRKHNDDKGFFLLVEGDKYLLITTNLSKLLAFLLLTSYS